MTDGSNPTAWKNPMAWLPDLHRRDRAVRRSGPRRPNCRRMGSPAGTADGRSAARGVDAGEQEPRRLRAGMRHLMVLLAVGIDMALRVDPDPRAGGHPRQHGRHRHLGSGMPGLRVHERELAGRRDVPAVRQSGYRPLRRSADDGRDGRHHQRPRRRTRGGRRRKLRGDPVGRRARRELAEAGRRSPDADGPKLPVRLGHRGARVAEDRARRRRGRAEGPFGGTRRLGVASAVRAGGVRLRQPEVLPRLRRDAAGQRLRPADGHVVDGCGRREPARHRTIRTRTR